jgi:phage terminase large subunit GpA-like protein
MVRGAKSENAPLLQRVKKEHNHRTGTPLKYSKRFYNFNGSVLKMALYRNVGKTDPLERGFVGFPRGLDDEYYRQLTAERRVPKKKKDGFVEYSWEKDRDQANEGLDTMNQAEAAAIKYGVRSLPEGIWRRLEAERETPLQDAQLDFEDGLFAAIAAVAPAPAATPSPTPAPVKTKGLKDLAKRWKR